MIGVNVFLNKILTVFLAWPNPASTPANPRCMIKTKAVANIIQILLAVSKFASMAAAAAASAPPPSCNASKKVKIVVSFFIL